MHNVMTMFQKMMKEQVQLQRTQNPTSVPINQPILKLDTKISVPQLDGTSSVSRNPTVMQQTLIVFFLNMQT